MLAPRRRRPTGGCDWDQTIFALFRRPRLPRTTAARILDIFHGLAGHHLLDQHGRLVLSFAPQLNELQQLVLDLLEIPHRIYTG
jgi:hypothetical protein